MLMHGPVLHDLVAGGLVMRLTTAPAIQVARASRVVFKVWAMNSYFNPLS